MSYVVIARKYRPQNFEEVVGQPGITQTLRNAIKMDRVAHAYIFAGPRGVGKTSVARIFAKALNCSKGPTEKPCNKCDLCQSISVGEDVDVIEIDGASNTSVDDVRALRENCRYVPTRGRYKIYIIDEVHMLSNAAFNALLKTLEEPPPHVKFIFATTESHKLPETIHSRCQRFDFRRISTPDIIARLENICKQEKINVEDAAIRAIAVRAEGGMRDAESLLDQLVSFTDGKVTLDDVISALGTVSREAIFGLIDAVSSKEIKPVLNATNTILEQGVDPLELLNQLIEHLRNLMAVTQCGKDDQLVQATAEDLQRMEEQGRKFSFDSLCYMIQILSEATRKIRADLHPRVAVEMALVKLSKIEDLRPLGEILQQLSSIEQSGSTATTDRPTRRRPDGETTVAETASGETDRAQADSVVADPPVKDYGVSPSEEEALSLDRVIQIWPEVMERAKASSGFPEGALESHPVEFKDGELMVQLRQTDNELNVPELTTLLEQYVEDACQCKVAVHITPAAVGPAISAGETARENSSSEKVAAERDPMVERAVSLFNGHVIKAKE